jgi:hypothetical protein
MPLSIFFVGWFSSSTYITSRKKVLRASAEGFGAGNGEPERVGQAVDRAEGKSNRERVLDLFARRTGG